MQKKSLFDDIKEDYKIEADPHFLTYPLRLFTPSALAGDSPATISLIIDVRLAFILIRFLAVSFCVIVKSFDDWQ